MRRHKKRRRVEKELERITAHHPLPRSRLLEAGYFRDPDMDGGNLLYRSQREHRAWHKLSGEHTPHEIVAFLEEHPIEEWIARSRNPWVTRDRRRAFETLFGTTDDPLTVIAAICARWYPPDAPEEILESIYWEPLQAD